MLEARWFGWPIAAACLVLYLATSYAGIRSPDAEVGFETCVALKERASFAVAPESSWPGFGLARGTGDRLYSVFGPLQPILCVPGLALADLALGVGIDGFTPNPSHYVGQGLHDFGSGRPISGDLRPHRRRGLVAWLFNALGTAVGVLLMAQLARRVASPASALLVAAAYGVATLAWPYAGTFFSEPTATAFVLGAALALRSRPTVSGLCTGLATAAHITGVLFVPFFAFAVDGATARERWARRARFASGLALPIGLLLLFNALRFGSPFETGRGADPTAASRFGYGDWANPVPGLLGLLWSPSKGLLWFCPAAFIAAVGWPALGRRDRRLAWALGGAILFRWVFIAARSDWHGGFALGPRLLLMVTPLLVLPLAPWLDAATKWARGALAAALAACAAAQGFWALKEPFAAFHYQKLVMTGRGLSPFQDDALYWSWEYAMARALPLLPDAPWMLGDLAPSVRGALVLVAGPAVIGATWRWSERMRARASDPRPEGPG